MKDEEKLAVISIVQANSDLFRVERDPLRVTYAIHNLIAIIAEIIFNSRPYRYPPAQRSNVQKQIDALLSIDIIEPSNLLYNSLLLRVFKKADVYDHKRWWLGIH